jgi:hypothetical protein
MITVSEMYIEGIKEGRAILQKHGTEFAREALENLNRAIEGFSASSPVGQMLRGERDFWHNQLRIK